MLSQARPQQRPGCHDSFYSASQLSQEAGTGSGFFQLQEGRLPLPVSGLDLLKCRHVFPETWALNSPGPAQASLVLSWTPWGHGTRQASSPQRFCLFSHTDYLTSVPRLWIHQGPRRSVNPGVSSQAANVSGLYGAWPEPWDKLCYFTNAPTKYHFSINET